MTSTQQGIEPHDSDLERLVFFSDGVFAIAITLLVIDVKAPEVPEAELSQAVWDMVPSLFAYALSFLVFGIYWMAHRRIFSEIVRGDGRLTWLNLMYLMLVSFLPFPTSMQGSYNDSRFAVIFYAAVHVAIGSVSLILWHYATHKRRLTRPDLPASAVWSGMVNGAVPPVFFALSIPVALIDDGLARYVWIGVAFSGVIRRVVVARWFGER